MVKRDHRARRGGEICVVCKTRTARRLMVKSKYTCCEPCFNLTAAENTREQYGLPKQNTQRKHAIPLKYQAEEYVALIKSGMTFEQIADLWKISRHNLATRMSRARRKGYAIPTQRSAPRPVVEPIELGPPKRGRPRNDHGGGKWGIKDCTCQQCVDVRAQARKALRAGEMARRKAADEAAAKKRPKGKLIDLDYPG